MIESVNKYLIETELFIPSSKKELEEFRIKYLGKKGILNQLISELKKSSLNDKKEYGRIINLLKNQINEKINFFKEFFITHESKMNFKDLTRPGIYKNLGSRHPISIVRNKIIEVLEKIGFELVDGPEIETDWYNFTGLNLNQNHPARDMQDTFFIEKDKNDISNDRILRTHTSSIQIRYMEKNKPPIRILGSGRVFRNESISSRSHCIFHQIEGLYIDKNVSFSQLKQTLFYLIEELLKKSKIRFRPSYFPFTEPSAEVDVYLGLKNEIEYGITKGTGWIEVMGCGMVDPNVLKNVGINPEEYSGYAFGIGIERIVMLLYQIRDIRMFFENDLRLIEQFKSETVSFY